MNCTEQCRLRAGKCIGKKEWGQGVKEWGIGTAPERQERPEWAEQELIGIVLACKAVDSVLRTGEFCGY